MRLGRFVLILVSVGVLVGSAAGPAQATKRITEYPIPLQDTQPIGITSGPDGNIWFTQIHRNRIGRITTGGAITEYRVPTLESGPDGITSGRRQPVVHGVRRQPYREDHH